ncbi:MAG: hypothetical protein VYB59_09075, partial [Pseudomonadota bacterium]|nr:hypothetical protein [Pseudomonadota bacterium]
SSVALETNAASRGFAVLIRCADLSNAGVIDSLQLFEDSHALVIGVDRYNAGWPVFAQCGQGRKVGCGAARKTRLQYDLEAEYGFGNVGENVYRVLCLKGTET